tara:strand:+ start:1400 stop:1663 length:264 start_codon:yes stop_codon:yes gene_type:complete
MSNEEEKILEKLKEKRIDKLDEKLDHNIRGYDHMIHYKDDHKADLISDWVDENIQIVINQHNIEIDKIKKMKIEDFDQNEIKEATKP